ncbi:MAG: hypothetical protein ACRDJN_25135 [Chloroflexota bacterium]
MARGIRSPGGLSAGGDYGVAEKKYGEMGNMNVKRQRALRPAGAISAAVLILTFMLAVFAPFGARVARATHFGESSIACEGQNVVVRFRVDAIPSDLTVSPETEVHYVMNGQPLTAPLESQEVGTAFWADVIPPAEQAELAPDGVYQVTEAMVQVGSEPLSLPAPFGDTLFCAPTPTATATATNTASPTATATQTATATATSTSTATATASPTPSNTPTATVAPSSTPPPSDTATATAPPTATSTSPPSDQPENGDDSPPEEPPQPTATPTPTPTATPVPTATPTAVPTASPTVVPNVAELSPLTVPPSQPAPVPVEQPLQPEPEAETAGVIVPGPPPQVTEAPPPPTPPRPVITALLPRTGGPAPDLRLLGLGLALAAGAATALVRFGAKRR